MRIFSKKWILFIAFLSILKGNEILYFMPHESHQAITHLVSLINGAKENINISIYSFTNKDIAKALKKSAARGVSVSIIYDKSNNFKNPKSTIDYLAKYKNIHTCLLEGKRSNNGQRNGLMHQKMVIIDKNVLILGSANWSKSAFSNNYETMILTSDQQSIQKSLEAFSKMFSVCTPY